MTMLMDGQFHGIQGELAEIGITLNVVARGEHLPEIERHIRTIKERVRCVYAMLPFKKIPSRMLVELVYFCVYWLNSFPARDGISDTLSPRAIVHGTNIDYNKHAKLEYGTYVQSHEEHDNTMATRTIGAIALRPTGNRQGSYYLYSLSTGKVLSRNHWTVLPMPSDVIDSVHQLARRSTTKLTFADRDVVIIPIEENSDDEAEDPNYEPDAEEEDVDAEDYPESDDSDDESGDNNGATRNIPQAIDPDLHIAGVYVSGYDHDGNNPPYGDNINEPPQHQNDNSGPELMDMQRNEVRDSNNTIPVQEQNDIQIEPSSNEENITEDITREHDQEMKEKWTAQE